MTAKLFMGVLAATVFAASSAFAQNSTPLPKDDAPMAEKVDVPFALSEAPDDHVIGSETAPITLIAYVSVTCGHCGDWFNDEWQAVKSELIDSGKVRFVLRELPTAPAQLAMIGFVLAQCAPEEDYFKVIEYQMQQQDKIFEQAQAGKAKEAYDKIAAMAGMKDDAAIQACFAEPANVQHVATSQMRANAAGVKGVPAFYVNGASYDGKQDAESLAKLIDIMETAGVSELPKSLPKELEMETTSDHSGHNH